jgi:hypothetical protein
VSDELVGSRDRVLYLELQSSFLVVKQDFSIVPSLREMIREYELAPKGNVAPEFLPPGKADDQ